MGDQTPAARRASSSLTLPGERVLYSNRAEYDPTSGKAANLRIHPRLTGIPVRRAVIGATSKTIRQENHVARF